MVLADKDMVVKRSNDNCVELFGHAVEDMLGQHVEMLMPENLPGQAFRLLLDKAQSGWLQGEKNHTGRFNLGHLRVMATGSCLCHLIFKGP